MSDSRNLPFNFGPTTNLAWRITVPAGRSSPVAWENRVFLTGYEGTRYFVVCFEVKGGRRLWEQTIEATRLERKSKPNDAASSTPVVDETGVYALLSGFGLVSFTRDGKERWRRPLDPLTPPHGMASSPVLAAGAVIVVADQVSDSHIAAFEEASGKPKWKTPRPNLAGGHATAAITDGSVVVRSEQDLWAFQKAGRQ